MTLINIIIGLMHHCTKFKFEESNLFAISQASSFQILLNFRSRNNSERLHSIRHHLDLLGYHRCDVYSDDLAVFSPKSNRREQESENNRFHHD